jgi:hypothetical protein
LIFFKKISFRYTPHPTDPSKTLLKQQATVSVEGVPLNRYMEDILTKNISFNASKGRQGLEWVIDKINTEVSREYSPCGFFPKIIRKLILISPFQVKGIASSAASCTDELLSHTKKSLDDITGTARKSMDELSASTQKIHF